MLRGDIVFGGYLNLDSTTKEVLEPDGWFHTGDIGEILPDGSLKIIDRKKNIFKLSQGEYIAVEKVEATFSKSEYVDMVRKGVSACCYRNYFQCLFVWPSLSMVHVTVKSFYDLYAYDNCLCYMQLIQWLQIWVYGNSLRSCVVAVVVPNATKLMAWAKENGVKGNLEEVCASVEAKEAMLKSLSKTGRDGGLMGFEVIKALHLEPMAFDVDRGLITPTFKLKRPQLLKYYQTHIDTMYSALG